jgi:glycosyltransferase involved in cell wall biosynthesis
VNGEPRISVVLCTHNGAETLDAALDALAAQDLGREQYEVVVVDDGSSDGSAEIARAAGARVVRLEANAGVPVARNAGIAAARAPIVAFTDDDCEPVRGWLRELLAAFDDPRVDGAGGPVRPTSDGSLALRYVAERNPLSPLPAQLLESNSPLYRLGLYLRSLARGRPDPEPGAQLYSLVTANCAFRVELLRSLGGFDESFVLGEDGELSRRAHDRAGTRFVFRPQALVRHRFDGLADSLRRARVYGMSNAHLAARREDVRPIVYPIPLLLAALAALTVARAPRLLGAVALLPPATYFGWTSLALRRRSVEPLAYAYLQLAEEVAAMSGEVTAWTR